MWCSYESRADEARQERATHKGGAFCGSWSCFRSLGTFEGAPKADFNSEAKTETNRTCPPGWQSRPFSWRVDTTYGTTIDGCLGTHRMTVTGQKKNMEEGWLQCSSPWER